MKSLFFILLTIPFICFSQHRTGGYLQAHFGFDLPKNVNFVYGAKLDGGVSINNTAFLGAGAGITKFDQVNGIYIPLYANFSFALKNPYSKFFPFLVLHPGYGIYNEDNKIFASNRLQSSGGFTYYAGVGVGISTQIKVKTCVTLGYSRYNFNSSSGNNFNFNGPSLRITVLML